MLVGDVNLSEVQARECVQDCAPPISGLPIQRAGGGLDHWQISSTMAGLSGDIMFTAGAAVKTTVVPIGKSFGYNAVRKDEHDTVSASLLVPCWAVKTGDAAAASGDGKCKECEEKGELRHAKPNFQYQQDEFSQVFQFCSKDCCEKFGSRQPRVPKLTPNAAADNAEEPLVPDRDRRETNPADASEARELDEQMREQQDEAWDTSPTIAEQLGRILFKKRMAEFQGQRVVYTASRDETCKALTALLGIRNAFLDRYHLPRRDKNGVPTRLESHMRTKILTGWEEEYHSQPDQKDLQVRDSWQETAAGRHKGRGKAKERKGGKQGGGASQPAAGGKGQAAAAKGKYGYGRASGKDALGAAGGKGQAAAAKGKYGYGGASGVEALGPNKDQVKQGKHSRWCRHLQREFGSKAIAEVIVFTGRVEPAYLDDLDENPPARVERDNRDRVDLRDRVISAKYRYRQGKALANREARGLLPHDDVERGLLDHYNSGRLRKEKNDAVLAYGHGKLVNDGGEELHIGGSTGGRPRRLMGTYVEPDLEAFRRGGL